MEFEVIKTQEEFDAKIGERLAREREKYKDYEEIKKKNTEYETSLTKASDDIKKLNDSKANLEKQINELNSKIKAHETNSVKMRICHDEGLPYEFAQRLSGENEEEITKDAKMFAKFFKEANPEPYAKTPQSNHEDDAYKKLLESLN